MTIRTLRRLRIPLGLVVAAVAGGASSVPTVSGCTTHQCDTTCVQYGGTPAAPCVAGATDDQGNALTVGDVFRDGDDYVWESSPMTGPWLDYPGERTYVFYWPPPMQGIVPYDIQAYVATDADAQAGGVGWINATGGLAEMSQVNGVGVTILNATCAEYFVRVVARARATTP
jgi:hypothetical protein